MGMGKVGGCWWYGCCGVVVVMADGVEETNQPIISVSLTLAGLAIAFY